MKREIISLALVKTIHNQFGYKYDYIENFVPFIANLVRKQNIDRIPLYELDDFVKAFHNEFGLNIPYHPMLTILERCRKRGLFSKESGQLIPITEKIQEKDFGDIVGRKEAKINELLQDLIKYGKDQFSMVISEDEAQNILLKYLSAHDMDVIFATQGAVITPIASTAPKLKYVFANYIKYTEDSNDTMFNLLVEVAVGHVLVNTIFYTEKLQKFAGKFKGLSFYIDAKFIFRVLGYEGDLFRSVYIDLLKALREQGSRLCMFNHTLEEIIKIIRGSLRWVDVTEYDPARASQVARFYHDAGKTQADIQQDLATIENKIKGLEICVVPSPEFIRSPQRQIDEIALQKSIITIYSERNSYFNPDEKQFTIDKDIKSISAIYHLRPSSRPQTMLQAQHFFLTTNRGLAYASRQYEMKDSEGEKFIPACVTDIFIGTLVWMQSPVRWVNLNQKRFLADCMALLNPSALFIKKLIDEAQKLKDAGRLTNDEFIVVRSSMYVQQTLMEETYGDPESISAESIEDVIKRIRCEATAPLVQQIKQKDNEVIELWQKNKVSEDEKERYKGKIEEICVTYAKRIKNIVCFGLWVLFIISLTVSFIDWHWIIQWILRGLSVCFVIAGFGFGRNIKNIRETVFLKCLTKKRKELGIGD